MRLSRAMVASVAIAYVIRALAPTPVTAGEVPAKASPISLSQPAHGNDPRPQAGDLTHLVFTATGNDLACALMTPVDGSYGGASSATIDVSTVAGAGVEVNAGGKNVPFSKIGKRVVLKSGETDYTYYGVPLEPGPNRIALTALGANGLRGKTTIVTLYGSGPATAIASNLKGKPVADGKTPLFLHVHGIDRWSHAALPGSMLRLTIVGGDAHFVARRGANGANPVATPATAGRATVAGAALNAPGGVIEPQPAPIAPQVFATATPPPAGYGGDTAGQPDARGNVPQTSGENYRAVGDLAAPTQSIDVPLGGGGEALVPIIPGLKPGDVIVRVTDGDATTEERFFLAPYVRPPLVLGLVTVGVGAVPGIPGEDATDTNGADSRRARGALFATGAIGASTLATLAYNTSDTLEENTAGGAFVDDPENRPYQLYGDASDHRVDALSRDHLYARVDSGRSSALWGDFEAQTGSADGIGGFNLLVHGFEATAGGANVRVTGFRARNDVAYARQVFSPTGLATTSTLLHDDIVVGSEIVSLVSLDRRTGAILTQNVLSRNVDYVLDNVTGQLRFINVPLPFDENFNPQQIVVSYEYGGVATDAETSGGRAEIALGASKAVKVGIGYVNDAYGSGNYSLFSQDVGGLLPGGMWSIGHATSKGSMQVATDAFDQSVGDGGDAYRLAFAMGDATDHVTAGFESTTAGYDNPFGGLSTPGLLQYELNFTRKLGSDGSQLTLQYDHEQNSTLGYANADSNASVQVNERITKRLGIKAGLAYRQNSTSGTPAQQLATTIGPDQPAPLAASPLAAAANGSSSTLQGQLGIDYRPIDPLRLSVTRLTDLAGGGDLAQPAQTSAEASYDFGNKGRAYVRELWSNAPQESFAASTASLTTEAQATRSTAFGIERALGSNTTVDSEYDVDNGGNGSDVYESVGVKERFSFGTSLHGDTFFQHANAIGTGLSGFDLYGLSLAYNRPNALKVTGGYQLRTGDGSGATLQLGAIGALTSSLSLIGSLQDSHVDGVASDDTNFGLAYRPYTNDRSVTLIGYRNTTGNVSALGSSAAVLSAEELYRPSWHLELAGRVAYKLDGDSYYAAHSELFGLRATQRIGNRFDIGAEARHLAVTDIAGASFDAFALEGGYRLGDQMRLGFGYNFEGSPDPGLAAAPTRRGIYGTATSTVDNIFGWGKSH